MSVRKRGPYHPDYVVEAARDLLVAGWQPTEIHRALHQKFVPNEVPPISTVQRWCRSWRYEDESGMWHPMSAEPGTAELVLDTLKDLVVASEGEITEITNSEAGNFSWIRRTCPKLEAVAVWYLSRYYLYRTAHNEGTGDLDLFVAFAPWRDQKSWSNYEWTVRSAWILPAPRTLYGMTQLRVGGAIEDPLTMHINGFKGPEWITRSHNYPPAQGRRNTKKNSTG